VQTSAVQVCRMTSRAFFNSFDLIQGTEGVSMFANISVGALGATTLSEVDEYLSRPVENILDPLKWWTDNRRVYPNLSSMALDYLSVPRKPKAIQYPATLSFIN
jgi:hAT family C-terminal dimerisation region